MPADSLKQLRAIAADVASRAHVPFSGKHVAAVLLLEDGSWIPGVRVESASYSLTIPPLLNAWTTAVALLRMDIRAVVISRPFRPEETLFVDSLRLGEMKVFATDAYVAGGSIPEPVDPLRPFLDYHSTLSPSRAIQLARDIAARAFIPESRFPVGCLLEISREGMIPGVNVESEDWSSILCAERNALGTAVSYGFASRIEALYLSCPLAPGATPCGACRQLLAELAPAATLWMDQGEGAPLSSTPQDLLPLFFSGNSLSAIRGHNRVSK
ncbi:MAG: cytidine deaminase [Rhodothermales bacterium]